MEACTNRMTNDNRLRMLPLCLTDQSSLPSNRCGEVVFIGACHLAICTRPGFDSPRRYDFLPPGQPGPIMSHNGHRLRPLSVPRRTDALGSSSGSPCVSHPPRLHSLASNTQQKRAPCWSRNRAQLLRLSNDYMPAYGLQ